jgi:transposase
MASRPGAERFARPTQPNQRRYEALRCYFVEGASAQQVAARFGYTRATVETLVRDYRAARLELFTSSRPGPRSEPKKDNARTLILTLRGEGRSLAQIARALTAAGTPLGRTAIWEVLRDEGLGRLPLAAAPTSPLSVATPKTQRLQAGDWPAAGSVASEHAGLFLLLPELVDLDVPALVSAGGYPGRTQLTALNSLLSILALKLYERRRRSHVYDVVHDQAFGVFAGLGFRPQVCEIQR